MMAAGVAAERLWSPRTTLDVQDARHIDTLRTKLLSRATTRHHYHQSNPMISLRRERHHFVASTGFILPVVIRVTLMQHRVPGEYSTLLRRFENGIVLLNPANRTSHQYRWDPQPVVVATSRCRP